MVFIHNLQGYSKILTWDFAIQQADTFKPSNDWIWSGALIFLCFSFCSHLSTLEHYALNVLNTDGCTSR